VPDAYLILAWKFPEGVSAEKTRLHHGRRKIYRADPDAVVIDKENYEEFSG